MHNELLYTLGGCGQQIEGIYYTPLHGTAETTRGMLQPMLSPLFKWMLKKGIIQWRTTSMDRDFEQMTFPEGLRKLGSFSMAKRKLRDILAAAYKYLNGSRKGYGA